MKSVDGEGHNVLTARDVLRRSCHGISTKCLKQLHLLPKHLRFEHKILNLVFKVLKGTAPQYMKDMLKLSKNVRLLRQYVYKTRYSYIIL